MNLTTAQISALRKAKGGGVFCLTVDRGYRTLCILMNLGLISTKRNELGYYDITQEGLEELVRIGE